MTRPDLGTTCPTCGQVVRPTPEERQAEIEHLTALADTARKQRALRLRWADFAKWVEARKAGTEADPLGVTSDPALDPLAVWLADAGCHDVQVSYRTVTWRDYEDGPRQTRKLPRWARTFTRTLDTWGGKRGSRAVWALEVEEVLARVRPILVRAGQHRAW